MKLYLITNPETPDYDQYQNAIVCAKSPKDARLIHPCKSTSTEAWENESFNYGDWPKYKNRDKIQVEYIGTPNAKQKRGVILSDFNAG